MRTMHISMCSSSLIRQFSSSSSLPNRTLGLCQNDHCTILSLLDRPYIFHCMRIVQLNVKLWRRRDIWANSPLNYYCLLVSERFRACIRETTDTPSELTSRQRSDVCQYFFLVCCCPQLRPKSVSIKMGMKRMGILCTLCDLSIVNRNGIVIWSRLFECHWSKLHASMFPNVFSKLFWWLYFCLFFVQFNFVVVESGWKVQFFCENKSRKIYDSDMKYDGNGCIAKTKTIYCNKYLKGKNKLPKLINTPKDISVAECILYSLHASTNVRIVSILWK